MEVGRGYDKNGAHKMSNNSKSCLLFYCSYYNIFLLPNVDYVTGSFIVFWENVHFVIFDRISTDIYCVFDL